jgi:hypothetical protein
LVSLGFPWPPAKTTTSFLFHIKRQRGRPFEASMGQLAEGRTTDFQPSAEGVEEQEARGAAGRDARWLNLVRIRLPGHPYLPPKPPPLLKSRTRPGARLRAEAGQEIRAFQSSCLFGKLGPLSSVLRRDVSADIADKQKKKKKKSAGDVTLQGDTGRMHGFP